MKTYFLKHVKDLKLHFLLFIYLFILLFSVSYFYSDQWIYILIKPLISLKKSNYFIFTDMVEIFSLKIYLSIIISITLSIVCFFFQIWFFLAPGLYKKENKFIIKILVFYNIFLLCTIYLIFLYLIPYAWNFFLGFETTEHPFLFNIYLEPKIYNYILFIIRILLLTSILFQYPLFIFLLLLVKVIEINQITKFRKLFYVKILIIASLIAPPDIWSQIIIFVFFTIIIEIFILFFFIFQNKWQNKV